MNINNLNQNNIQKVMSSCLKDIEKMTKDVDIKLISNIGGS